MTTHKNNKTSFIVLSIFILLFSIFLFKNYSTDNESYHLSNNYIVQHQNKSIMLFGMHQAARERLLILYKMSLEIDPFILDGLNIELSEQASIFINYRREYKELPLTPEEVDLLKKQIEATKIGAQYMSHISSLLINNEHKQARELLTTIAEAAQKNVLQLISQQIKIHKQQLFNLIKKNKA